MSNLLCVDFDSFFYNPLEAGNTDDETFRLHDWGHSESLIFLSNMLWETRAAAFFQHDLPLPGVRVPDGGWEAFWARFQFADEPWYGYADSNAYAGLLTPPDGSPAFEHVVLFDAHHDSGYHVKSFTDYLAQGTFTCEDWMLEHQRRGTQNLTVHYPTWKPHGPEEKLPDGALTRQVLDDGQPLDIEFDTVFVCRSGAWVPPWCDPDFLALIDAFPYEGEQVDDEDLDRRFTPDNARVLGAQMKDMMEKALGHS